MRHSEHSWSYNLSYTSYIDRRPAYDDQDYMDQHHTVLQLSEPLHIIVSGDTQQLNTKQGHSTQTGI